MATLAPESFKSTVRVMARKVYFDCNRISYRRDTTIGTLSWPDGRSSFVLEDVVRGWGIKDKSNTAIPHNQGSASYKMRVSFSNRFQRKMVQLYTEPDGTTLKAGGISFTGIRVHGGNRANNTAGCPLIARNRVDDFTIQGSMERELTELVEKYESQGIECYWRVRNSPQAE